MINLPTIPKPEAPVLFDTIITQVQDTLASELSWLDHAFGRSQKLTGQAGDKRYSYPAVHIRSRKYQDVSPDKRLGSYSFFVMEDPQQVTFYPQGRNILKTNFALIFWVDLEALYPDSKVSRNTEAVKSEILGVLTRRMFLSSGRLSITGIKEQADNVFREYDLNEIKSQYLMQPYAAFRFEGQMLLTESCVIQPDVIAPVFLSAVVEDAASSSVVMAYGESLDETSTPAVTDFVVNDGAANTVTNVVVSGTTVTLTLTNAIDDGDTVVVSYTAGVNPIQDEAGNNAADLTNQAVTNNVVDDIIAEVMVALWYRVDGTSMIDMLGNHDPLTLSTAPEVPYIPADYEGTITAPDVAALKAADVNNILYTSAGVANDLSVADFIDVDLERIPVKYDSVAPYNIRMIGIFDPAIYSSLTDADKTKISNYMDLWIYYWDTLLGGNIKMNRTLPTEAFTFATASADLSQSYTVRLPVGKTLTIDWGDGSEDSYSGNGASSVTVTHTYAGAGSYDIKFKDDYLSLTYLNCNSNSLTGDVSSWSALVNLTYLNCYNNSLTGDVSSWYALTNLTYLICSSNSLTGDVSSWSALTSLTYLDCNANSLTGDVSGWSALTNLTDLRCYNNPITGDISSWSALTNLTHLYCYVCSLTGDISSWSALVNLERLYIWRNSFTGDVSSWSAMTNIERIYCYDNLLYFDTVTNWLALNMGAACRFDDNSMSSTQVDNALNSFANGPFLNTTINLGPNNAVRTSTSDAAVTTLIANGCTVITNGLTEP